MHTTEHRARLLADAYKSIGERKIARYVAKLDQEPEVRIYAFAYKTLAEQKIVIMSATRAKEIKDLIEEIEHLVI